MLKAIPTTGGAAPMFTFFDAAGTPLQGQSLSDTLEFTLLQDTSVYVELISNSACANSLNASSVATMFDFIVDGLPTTSNAGLGGTVCEDTVTLSANVPTSGTGHWVFNTSDFISIGSDTDPTMKITNLPSGIPVTLKWVIESTNGGCPADTSEVTITKAGNITASEVNSQSTPLCGVIGLTHQLTGTSVLAGEVGTWTVVAPGLATIDASGLTSNLEIGSNKFVYTITGVCDPTRDTVELTVESLPLIPQVYDKDSTLQSGDFTHIVCESELVVEALGTGVWSISGGVAYEDAVLSPESIRIAGIAPGTPSTATWTVEGGTCRDTSVTITINQAATVTSADITISLIGTSVYDGDTYTVDATDTICYNPSFTYQLSGPSELLGSTTETGVWSFGGGTVKIADLMEMGTQDLIITAADLATDITLEITSLVEPTCPTSTRTMSLFVQGLPTLVSIIEGDTNLCAGEQITLNASGTDADTYSWFSDLNIGEVASPTADQTTFTAATVGNILFADQTGSVTLIAENECGSTLTSDVIKVEVTKLPEPSFTLSQLGSDLSKCAGANFDIVATGITGGGDLPVFTWYVDGDDQMVNSATLSIPNITGVSKEIRLVMQSNAECVDQLASDTFDIGYTIEINSPLANIIEGEDSAAVRLTDYDYICSDYDNLIYTVEGTLLDQEYTVWCLHNGSGDTIPLPTSSYADLSSIDAIDLYFHNQLVAVTPGAVLAGCKTSAPPTSITIDVTPVPEPGIIGGDVICADEAEVGVLLDGSGGIIVYNTTYQWSTDDENLGTSASQPIYEGGTYYLNLENTSILNPDKQCPSSDSVSKTVTGYFFEGHGAGIEKDEYWIDLEGNPAGELTVDSKDYAPTGSYDPSPTYNWYFEGGTSLSNTTDVEFTTLQTQVLVYEITHGGCRSIAKADITVYKSISVPEVFTPNGDGINDNWVIVGLETYKKYDLKVFNRWGNLIHRGTNSSDGVWDGTNMLGMDVSDAVYYYILDLNENDKPVLRGNVTIVR